MDTKRHIPQSTSHNAAVYKVKMNFMFRKDTTLTFEKYINNQLHNIQIDDESLRAQLERHKPDSPWYNALVNQINALGDKEFILKQALKKYKDEFNNEP